MIDLDELRKKAEAANACDGGPITVDELRFIQAVTPNVVIELIERVEMAEAKAASERERCAKIAEKHADLLQTNDYDMGWCRSAWVIANAIRAGG